MSEALLESATGEATAFRRYFELPRAALAQFDLISEITGTFVLHLHPIGVL
jgi:hypothetical protein